MQRIFILWSNTTLFILSLRSALKEPLHMWFQLTITYAVTGLYSAYVSAPSPSSELFILFTSLISRFKCLVRLELMAKPVSSNSRAVMYVYRGCFLNPQCKVWRTSLAHLLTLIAAIQQISKTVMVLAVSWSSHDSRISRHTCRQDRAAPPPHLL